MKSVLKHLIKGLQIFIFVYVANIPKEEWIKEAHSADCSGKNCPLDGTKSDTLHIHCLKNGFYGYKYLKNKEMNRTVMISRAMGMDSTSHKPEKSCLYSNKLLF